MTTTTHPSGSGYRLGSATNTTVIPKPKAKCVQSSLLSYLDNDYFGRNHFETLSASKSQPTPLEATYSEIDASTTKTVTTSVEDNADIHNESQLDDERLGDTDDIFADVVGIQIEDVATTLTPGQRIAADSVEDDVIPATPPPAAPPRSKTGSERKSIHERQKKISDFLMRK